jgi:hypothetical protein
VWACNEKRVTMSIVLTDELAEAALRAASAGGYPSVVEGLLNSGVKASALHGAAVILADFYGHAEVAKILRAAMSREGASFSTIPPPGL